MKVFISWSGDSAKDLGHAMKAFIEVTFASHVETFLSDVDVAAGVRFMAAINSNLDDADLGIVIITRANQRSPWLLFEAGALAARSAAGNVIPLLVDLERGDMEPPLDQFQNVVMKSRESIETLADRIWNDLGNVPSATTYQILKDQAWPALEAAFESAIAGNESGQVRPRDTGDILNEILLGVNALVRRTVEEENAVLTPRRVTGGLRDNGRLQIEAGMRLRHIDFGVGTVQTVTGAGDKRVAHVSFEQVGPKKLLVKIAPITILEDEVEAIPGLV